jgi:hypothetical protein
MRPSARGQAMAELAVALIVFVTVVVFGIHFAEVGYLSLRVQEAAISPLWDATALRTHQMQPNPGTPGDFSAFPAIAPEVTSDANTRYRDFDGRRSANGSTSITHVFTRLSGMTVECAEDPTIEFDLPSGSGRSVLTGIYENVGGMNCTAHAELRTLPSLTSTFLEGTSGFFQEQHAVMRTWLACAAGRGIGGTCDGRYGILLGDFAFHDTAVSGSCSLQPEQPDVACPENPAYYYSVRKVFDANQRGFSTDASNFANFFVGYSPIDENGFFMSYRGVEHGYIENDTPVGEPNDMMDRPRNTGGVEDRPPKRRQSNRCFLGINGC